MALPYQLTQQASKGNAFCWLSWEPQIKWRGTKDEVAAQNKRNEAVEAKRATGIDPLHIPTLRSRNPLDPARFALPGMSRNANTPWRARNAVK